MLDMSISTKFGGRGTSMELRIGDRRVVSEFVQVVYTNI